MFFVEVFNKILIAEENFLNISAFNNLSVKEMHIIEAIGILTKEKTNTMGIIARQIGITVGALTTAVNVVIDKGYVTRERIEADRRVVKLYLTELGKEAEKLHENFHKDLVKSITEIITENELKTLIFSLEQLKGFFNQYLNHLKGK